MKTVICYTGGSARGNPGPAAVGVYITDATGNMMSETAETIGNSTDTFACYQAVMVGLQALLSLLGTETTTTHIEVRLGNELVKKQLNAESPLKEPGFVPLFIEIHNMQVESFPHLTFTLVPQTENTEVERLIHEALGTI
jgi:ribonuclease HI